MTQAADPIFKRCPKCGQRNRFTAKICTQCGTPFLLVKIDGVLRKRCASCGGYNRVIAKVCARCGTAYPKVLQTTTKIQAPKWCSNCGMPRKPTAKVCTRCGHRFGQNTPAEPPITLSDALAEPVSAKKPAAPSRPWPRPAFDTSGQPAPYLSPAELQRLQGETTAKRSLLQTALDFVRAIVRGSR